MNTTKEQTTKCCKVPMEQKTNRRNETAIRCSKCKRDTSAPKEFDWRNVPGNFEDKGQVFLVRCPRCRKENPTGAVATGKCAFCGWQEA